jgi:cytochrome b subunit of formate dehydrogenase
VTATGLMNRTLAAGLVILLAAARVAGVEVSQAEIDNRRCLNCHGQSHIGTLSPADRRAMVAPTTRQASTRPTTHAAEMSTRPGLYIATDALAASVHAKLACVQCHQDAKTLPHPEHVRPASCDSSCHTKSNSDFLQGAHAAATARGDATAPTCSTCHGDHNILPRGDRNSRTHPLNIVKVCGECHQKHSPGVNGTDGKQHIDNYLESVHGRAVTRGGLAVAATCADCHSNHKVLPAKDPQSSVNRANVAVTCGQCHVGLEEMYQTSVHGQELAKGNPEAPVCSDCHTAHAITRTDTPGFMLDIVAECGQCHDKPRPGSDRKTSLYRTYRRSYHGQATSLGFTRGARCSNCHGAHDVRRITDPESRLSPANRVQTCKQCHAEATASFAQFESHADHRDGKRYPLLHGVWLYFVIMMSCAFGFFGLHSVLWFARSLIERIKHGPRPRHHADGHAIQRFNKVDRVNHAFVIISFFGLTLTGLPLLYADQHWAKTLAAMLGGVRQAGLLHRFFAIMLIGNFAVHFVGLFRRFQKYGVKQMLFGPATMLPRWKDVTDCLGMWRWFFRGGEKPKFDRWTYWEKFDYVAEVGGSMIIGLTGLMLWFPQYVAQYLRGWMFNVASVVHGYEALLAIGFIFTIHFFNAHLRMEKFPVDDVMFTGRLPEEEFKHERGAEYERLAKSGELERLRVAPAPDHYRKFAVLAGLIAMAIGTTLVVLIIMAGLRAT